MTLKIIYNKIRNIKFSKNLKQYFLWPLIIAFISFLMTSLFWYYSDKAAKKSTLLDKRLHIISDLTETFYAYDYYAGFRGMIDLEQINYVKDFHELTSEGLQITELSIQQRIDLAASMEKRYSFVYGKMIEGDTKSSPLYKNIILAKLFFSNSVSINADKFMMYVPIDDKINSYMKERMKVNKTNISESEKNKLLRDLQKESHLAFEKLINQMVLEVK